jgi:hypothetical protein
VTLFPLAVVPEIRLLTFADGACATVVSLDAVAAEADPSAFPPETNAMVMAMAKAVMSDVRPRPRDVRVSNI